MEEGPHLCVVLPIVHSILFFFSFFLSGGDGEDASAGAGVEGEPHEGESDQMQELLAGVEAVGMQTGGDAQSVEDGSETQMVVRKPAAAPVVKAKEPSQKEIEAAKEAELKKQEEARKKAEAAEQSWLADAKAKISRTNTANSSGKKKGKGKKGKKR